ncbi:hypothetical protein LOK49_LG03G01763 [Camellia lanceoleosa]|uniref:Uncharacterized protein n=1 Tax=Camellia lanceoleosa TaxID=1840588 RepID=A0ACC0IE56_9ERIC|nr:hypothetical protein LOK49_LG03G01763 [Camellia lanceoleosa]
MSIPFVVDLNGKLLWVNCEKHNLSSTYNAPFCHSTQCSRANSHYCHKCISPVRPGCHNNTCGVLTTNPITNRNAIGELAQDLLAIQSTRGLGPCRSSSMVIAPQFIFACAPSFLLNGPLPKNVQGMVGLGHSPISLPSQLASNFGIGAKFGLCLTSSPNTNGVIFFGDGPYNMTPGIDISNTTAYTPLSTIKINEKIVPTKQDFSGTIISATTPYTILEHSLFATFTRFFANQFSKVPQVKPVVSPFGVCFDSTKLPSTQVGPGVPNIDFVLHDRNALWRIFGANSIVQARPGVACLAFADGGPSPKSPIVIGAYQLEDNLLQFDLAQSRLGFSSSLLSKHTSCAKFNFTSTP